MTTPHARLDNVFFEHSTWLNELAFYVREMTVYERQIGKYLKYLPGEEIPQQVLEAGQTLKAYRNVAHSLINEIKEHVSSIDQMVKSNGNLTEMTDSVHPKVRLKMAVLRKDYTAWKEHFHQLFIAIIQEKPNKNL